MTEDYKIDRQSKGFKRPSRKELEEAANLLLYGERRIIETAEGKEQLPGLWSFYRPSRKPNEYVEPILVTDFKTTLFCVDCNRRRSRFSAERCRQCYRRRARELADIRFETSEYWLRLSEQPATEYWDQSDIPTRRKSQAWIGRKIRET